MTHFEPANMFFAPGQTSRRLVIHGKNFVPLTDEMLCRVSFTDTLDEAVNAVYINNHTLACDVPEPPEYLERPLAALIEVSFN